MCKFCENSNCTLTKQQALEHGAIIEDNVYHIMRVATDSTPNTYRADVVKLVSDEEYKPWLMQKRNEYMVDLSDKIIAVWDGTNGGTSNCVKYADKMNKEIIRIIP